MTDTAKELLALKPGEAIGLGPSADRDLAEQFIPETFQQELRALRRLSARQQASVADLGVWIYLNYGVGMEVCETIARALLAKYDIFEKVEG